MIDDDGREHHEDKQRCQHRTELLETPTINGRQDSQSDVLTVSIQSTRIQRWQRLLGSAGLRNCSDSSRDESRVDALNNGRCSSILGGTVAEPKRRQQD